MILKRKQTDFKSGARVLYFKLKPYPCNTTYGIRYWPQTVKNHSIFIWQVAHAVVALMSVHPDVHIRDIIIDHVHEKL